MEVTGISLTMDMFKSIAALLLSSCLLAGCFNELTDEQDTRLKIESLALDDRGLWLVLNKPMQRSGHESEYYVRWTIQDLNGHTHSASTLHKIPRSHFYAMSRGTVALAIDRKTYSDHDDFEQCSDVLLPNSIEHIEITLLERQNPLSNTYDLVHIMAADGSDVVLGVSNALDCRVKPESSECS